MRSSRLSIPISLFRRNHQLVYARHQRRAPTASEAVLWSVLRHRHVIGFRTKRQPVVGPYVPDFVVPSVRLVIEIDGSAHHGKELADAFRTRELEAIGYSVLRLTARQVMRSPLAAAGVVAAEVHRLAQLAP